MKSIFFAIGISLSAGCLCINAYSQDMQLKGKMLGSSFEACEGEKVDDLQEGLARNGLKNITHPAADCDIKLTSFAGLIPSEPAKLLFWNTKLARMIIKFDRISLQQVANVRTALIDKYGKPKTVRNPPFIKDKWTNRGQSLELETTWYKGDPVSSGIYLTDEKAFAEFIKSDESITRLLEKMKLKRRAQDIE